MIPVRKPRLVMRLRRRLRMQMLAAGCISVAAGATWAALSYLPTVRQARPAEWIEQAKARASSRALESAGNPSLFAYQGSDASVSHQDAAASPSFSNAIAASVREVFSGQQASNGDTQPPAATNTRRFNCRVDAVYDGDTPILSCEGLRGGYTGRTRLQCIDTPEMDQGKWGAWARDYLASLIPAGTQVEFEHFEDDRYGRPVGRLHLRGNDLNLALVAQGVAAVYDRYCKDRAYYDHRDQARTAARGIWSAPGAHQTPWDHRKGQG